MVALWPRCEPKMMPTCVFTLKSVLGLDFKYMTAIKKTRKNASPKLGVCLSLM